MKSLVLCKNGLVIHMDPGCIQRQIKYKAVTRINDPWRCFHPALYSKKDLIKISLLQTFHMCDIFCSEHEMLFNTVLCRPPSLKLLSPLKYWIRAVFRLKLKVFRNISTVETCLLMLIASNLQQLLISTCMLFCLKSIFIFK